MTKNVQFRAGWLAALLLLAFSTALFAEPHSKFNSSSKYQHVLLISIDGFHSLDFANCTKGVAAFGNQPYCPNIASLTSTSVQYVQALTSRPSDSFPGLTALVTGATPRSTGAFYDVSYDRSLSPPAKTTPYGIIGGPGLCPKVIGTQVGNDEEIDINYKRIDAGGGINPDYLPRDPNNGCAPVYPHTFIRVNTIFNVVKNAGGYTAWSDKHQSYELTKGPTGDGVDDFFSPEINSRVVPLNFPGYDVPGCRKVLDKTATDAWTSSFQNIQCYDKLKVQAVLNWIDGKTHDGSQDAPVPNVFGMNFQAVSVGQKLVESTINVTGGYQDALGTPSEALYGEIQFVDNAIGEMINQLKVQNLYNSTLIIISAKHGQSPIDPNRLLRIPADNSSDEPPSQILSPSGIGPGFPVVQALEDDISLIWLADQTQTTADLLTLSQPANSNIDGGGEVFGATSLNLMFNDALSDPRTPDIIVVPNVGTVYTGGTGKVAEHGGFANDDRNVILLVSNPALRGGTFVDQVETRQIAPTIIRALGLDPSQLQAVQLEHTQSLPGLSF
jgi:hypothetical protein